MLSGRVQGVFYRASTLEKAHHLGLVGWVMNLPDGRVEVWAEGPRYRLEKLVDWARNGPRLAKVSNIKIRWLKATGEFDTFRVK